VRKDNAFLEDIRLAEEDIAGFISGITLKEFLSDAKTRFAIERQLITIGEAANNVSVELRGKHPNVPWARLIHLRNFYVHAYDRLTPEEVWGSAKKLVPRAARLIAPLIVEEEEETG
jgi:uncharacterized protein with HEPN domain